jgi:ferredoxin/flavodoxin---NADP+ reductase
MPRQPLTYNATLVRREDFTPQLTTFHFRQDERFDDDSPFMPGQYVALGLNNDSRPELRAVRRSMSIASAPEQHDALEFFIRFVERPESDNPLTHLLWRMQGGDRIHITRRPAGKFTLEHTMGRGDERIRIYVAAGTGLAPFISMVRSMKLSDPKADMGRVILIHGASYPRDHCYARELMRYAEENGLRYFPTVSRPLEAPDWAGDTGRAEDYFLAGRLEDFEQRAGLGRGRLTPLTAAVLVCGLQGTIARSTERLARRGFVPADRRIRRALGLSDDVRPSLWWEQYDAEPVLDIHDPRVVAALKQDLDSGTRSLGRSIG